MEEAEQPLQKIKNNESTVYIVNNCVNKNIALRLPNGVKLNNYKNGVILNVPDKVQVCIDKSFLNMLATQFKAGSISKNFENWKALTSDAHILGIVKYGLPLRLSSPPTPNKPFRYNHNKDDSKLINEEITALLKKGAIQLSEITTEDYFSPIFVRVNTDGTSRLLLNLKTLNKGVEALHFKMETFNNVLQMLKPNCWLASVDLKSAYYSIPIHPEHRKYLKFYWDRT